LRLFAAKPFEEKQRRDKYNQHRQSHPFNPEPRH
jgi:hypothetical protein